MKSSGIMNFLPFIPHIENKLANHTSSADLKDAEKRLHPLSCTILHHPESRKTEVGQAEVCYPQITTPGKEGDECDLPLLCYVPSEWLKVSKTKTFFEFHPLLLEKLGYSYCKVNFQGYTTR